MHQDISGTATLEKVDNEVEHLRVQYGRRLEEFSSRCGAGEDKNSRANDRADAQRRQRPWPQRLL